MLVKAQSRFNRLKEVTERLIYSAYRKSNYFVTCTGKTDGAGAQIQAVLSTLLYAHEFGLQYVHTPFQELAHNDENDPNFAQQWEDFVNLGFDEPSVYQLDLTNFKTVSVRSNLDKIDLSVAEPKTLFVVTHCHQFADRYPHRYSKLLKRFQYKYQQSLHPKVTEFDPTQFNIALHVRRGDVNQTTNCERYTTNQTLKALIENISDLLAPFNVKTQFHLYSQGQIEDFPDLDHIVFHLNEPAMKTFHHLVQADVLLMAKSSFSYSAALFSQGIKLYSPFWHRPLRDWITVQPDGEFDSKQFKVLFTNIARNRY
ncbi:hypothetical protein NIES2135_09160 [Leptolyngbya boryana NIES-2135]|jgi:hypothetical protein|uniref:Uncharacterized protein n=1 Tax=Leptolyngbya boryana NIES-2135 TaxID=1973484 RepID=A0A1Z4JBH8_LEPBY|nr:MULTISPECIES: hypothetical protein [Leptolyngbya]BAY54102.1 hypothetical protein NIES2135_09160 [Leptolyngbya boryana NIES-2135]MBD2369758.1 hypothetical protein [Leptolyngbya sp. FACHB-161]MBD2376041.1 hypothetical protein [Leptolyngbya sp. FACHB-238]MBD2400317.1 hypothetical protein [Leptolyngbya sp. FACHB-239]MBD2406858.1 hypothetical protein [Leptolyngbya sp. FACHB-402]